MDLEDKTTGAIRPIFAWKNSKRRRYDLTCVVCHGPAYGYNFSQITCRSCKEFFRRTALVPLEQTKCHNLAGTDRCSIEFHVKNKCQCCRLLQCLEVGMRKDRLLTSEKKLFKQQRIEANRHTSSFVREGSTIQHGILTDVDRACLSHIRTSYDEAMQSIAPASTLYPLEPSIQKSYSLSDLVECDQFFPLRLINFLRSIPEFQALDPNDRVTLIKCNYTFMAALRDALIYDPERDVFFDDNKSTPISPLDEKYAHICTNLCILFCGYGFYRLYTSHLRLFSREIENNPLIIHLLMLVLIFLEGTAINDEQTSFLTDPQSVFRAHSKYVDLFYRYLLEQYSSTVAPKKMFGILQSILNLQNDACIYRRQLSQKSTRNDYHPLMKAVWDLA